jgi:serine/threonine-protein kinase
MGFALCFGFFLLAQLASFSHPAQSLGRWWRDPFGQLHFGASLLFLVLWLVCRGRPLTAATLAALDAAFTVGASLGFSLPVVWADLGLYRRHGVLADFSYAMILALTHTVVGRAVVVPSGARRTAAISLAVVLPGVAGAWRYAEARVQAEAPELATVFVLIAVLWAGLAVAVATVTSRTIYGLRQQVRRAMRLGQYTLEEKLGEGGMGVVYKASHAMLRRPTAIKLLPPEKARAMALKRFEREVQLTAQLTSPNTVTVYDYGRTVDGLFYYVMEYLEGVDLEALVAADGPQPAARVVHVLRQVCGALEEAHGVGLIHRDIKPANIILCSRRGGADFVKVVDFGLVKSLDVPDEGLTGDGLAGTPLYLPPEALRSPETVDARSDLYALGAVAYFMLTGRPVFEGRTLIDVCDQHLHVLPVPPSARGAVLPAALERTVLRCLAKDAQERPQSAAALRAELDDADSGAWTEEDAGAWWRERGQQLLARGTVAQRELASQPTSTVAIDLGGRFGS